MKILVTGAAGFIGFHAARRLTREGHEVVGLDNMNDYYSPDLKYARLEELGIDRQDLESGKIAENKKEAGFRFFKSDLEEKEKIDRLFEQEGFDAVIHLAAQAGVRNSITNPYEYIGSNVTGFLNILEAMRHNPVDHFIFASSSSVYGANSNVPFSVTHNVDHPVSLYAATKKSNELMAHTYAHLYDIPTTGLRFFTVYGPWGRPDMAYYLFTDAIVNGKPIKVFNHGEMERDFTYVQDIVEGIFLLIPKAPEGNDDWSGENPDPATSFAPYRLFNIGNSNPVNLMEFITEIESKLGIEAEKKMMDIQPGDVPVTWANVEDLYSYIDFRPQVGLEEGIGAFVDWYREYKK
jgi:UDP-glucuronate 4-epimerase